MVNPIGHWLRIKFGTIFGIPLGGLSGLRGIGFRIPLRGLYIFRVTLGLVVPAGAWYSCMIIRGGGVYLWINIMNQIFCRKIMTLHLVVGTCQYHKDIYTFNYILAVLFGVWCHLAVELGDLVWDINTNYYVLLNQVCNCHH